VGTLAAHVALDGLTLALLLVCICVLRAAAQ